jgi:hypothetical protein
MRMTCLVIGCATALALAGCRDGGEQGISDAQQATTEPQRATPTLTVKFCCPSTPTERVRTAIKTCEVRSIMFADDATYVTYRDGRKVRSHRLDENALMSAVGSREDGCRIIIGFAE